VTNIRIHPPRLLVDSVSSLDSIEVVFAVCRKTLPTTHAAMVSARVGGDDRDDIQVNRNMVGSSDGSGWISSWISMDSTDHIHVDVFER
jgi:hypothetical protein